MALSNYIFDNNWSQRSDIESLKDRSEILASRLEHSRAQESTNESRIEEPEQEVGELAHVAKVLVEIILEKGLCSEDELKERISSTDRVDGALNDVIARSDANAQSNNCSECGQKLPRGCSKCLYCGHDCAS
jgi:hypothetical protein